MEHENSRLIGELIGEMKGVREGIASLNRTVAASIDSTHARFELTDKEIRELKNANMTKLAQIKGGAFTAFILITLMVKGGYEFIVAILESVRGIKL